jgi:hypothetical protein
MKIVNTAISDRITTMLMFENNVKSAQASTPNFDHVLRKNLEKFLALRDYGAFRVETTTIGS